MSDDAIQQLPATEALRARSWVVGEGYEAVTAVTLLLAHRVARDLERRLEEARAERQRAEAFASRVERGEVAFAEKCDQQLAAIIKLPLGKRLDEDVSETVGRVLEERDVALERIAILESGNDGLRESLGRVLDGRDEALEVAADLAMAVRHYNCNGGPLGQRAIDRYEAMKAKNQTLNNIDNDTKTS